jgi:hypothetical protein
VEAARRRGVISLMHFSPTSSQVHHNPANLKKSPQARFDNSGPIYLVCFIPPQASIAFNTAHGRIKGA